MRECLGFIFHIFVVVRNSRQSLTKYRAPCRPRFPALQAIYIHVYLRLALLSFLCYFPSLLLVWFYERWLKCGSFSEKMCRLWLKVILKSINGLNPRVTFDHVVWSHFRSGYRNFSHRFRWESFPGLHLRGRSGYTIQWSINVTQRIRMLTFSRCP